jgi:hypothetical protein
MLIPNAENKDQIGAFWLQNLNLSFLSREKKTIIMEIRVVDACVIETSNRFCFFYGRDYCALRKAVVAIHSVWALVMSDRGDLMMK